MKYQEGIKARNFKCSTHLLSVGMLCLQRAVDNGGQSSNISTCGGNVKTRETKLEPQTNKTPPTFNKDDGHRLM